MNRAFAITLVVLLFFGARGLSWRSSAKVVGESVPYKFQESPTPTPTATPVPSPSPSPSGTATPVPEPEPVPSPTPTPFDDLPNVKK